MLSVEASGDEFSRFLNRPIGVSEVESFDNQCSAITRAGRRCKNPVFHSQWFNPGWETVQDFDDGSQLIRPCIHISEHEHARMRAQVCTVHEQTFDGRHE